MAFLNRLFDRQRSARTALPSLKSSRLHLEPLESRLVPYAVSGNAWPNPSLITLSFMPDGTNLGGVYSNLFAAFNAKFGSASVWQNQILKAAQVWAQQTNINFAVVPDSGASTGAGNYAQGDSTMGDIRIGGFNFGNSILGQAYMPPPVNNYSIAGDITFNTGQTFNIGSTYDLFTVAVHEIGHALGLYHSAVISADMYAMYTSTKSSLTSDDIAGIRNIYSNNNPRSPDAYGASNNSFATAANLTAQINTPTLTYQNSNLDITNASQADSFTFTAPSGSSSTMTISVQSSGLSLLSPVVYVYNANQTLLGSASGAGRYGTTLTLTLSGISAGSQYYTEVTGADTTAFGTGRYALTLNLGTGQSPKVVPPKTQSLVGPSISAGGGQGIAVSAEFLVNTYTSDIQQTFPQSPQSVAMDANGNFVVTWSSHNQDGSGWGVYAQRYDAFGQPQGSEFQVNSYTHGDQMYSTVAMSLTGSYVISWSSHNQDGEGWGVYAQRYDANGVPQGGEFQVNSYTQDNQMYSTVAMDANGNFVVTWSSRNQDGDGWGVYAQRYDANGVPQGGEFQVNSYTQDNQMYSTVAMDANGNFVITWSSHKQDGNGWGVYAQRYDANGVPQGGEFQVNSYTKHDQMYSTVAMNANGNFVISWSSKDQDGSGWGISAQRYDANGVPQGGEFQVNSYTPGDQEYSTVAMDATGNLLVTWSSNGQVGDAWGVYARQFDPSGVPLGSEFRVNTTTVGNEQYSSVAMNNINKAVVVWSGNGPNDQNGVFAQRYFTANNFAPGETLHLFSPPGGPGCGCATNQGHGQGCTCPACRAATARLKEMAPQPILAASSETSSQAASVSHPAPAQLDVLDPRMVNSLLGSINRLHVAEILEVAPAWDQTLGSASGRFEEPETSPTSLSLSQPNGIHVSDMIESALPSCKDRYDACYADPNWLVEILPDAEPGIRNARRKKTVQ